MDSPHYTNILFELECPICKNYMSPPIHQCVTGHSICEDCRRKLTNCALCQGVFSESRNIALESLAVTMVYPCINHKSGCTVNLVYSDRDTHKSKCQYGGYKCAMEKCTWVGALQELKQHWATKRIISEPFCANNICHAKIKSDFYYINLIEAYGKLFWFKFKLNIKRVYWAVQYIGKPEEAQNYYYEIEIFTQDSPKRKILFSSYCHGINISNTLLFNGKNCVFASLDIIEPFMNDERGFAYHMRVWVNKEDFVGPEANDTSDSGRKQRG